MQENDIVLLSHGGGGLRTRQLIGDIIIRHLGNPVLNRLDDGACLAIAGKDLVFTTDSFVVRPLFFPGGDIGRLAVCGTVNDLAMMGAMPRCLSLGLILEEGLPIADLERVVLSMRGALDEAKVKIVTGDTKVVERGMGFGMFVNTAGIGVRFPGADTGVANARPGDVVILTGTIGDHGAAIMACREGLKIESGLLSDVAPLSNLTTPLLRKGVEIHCLRDPTRGGMAAALNDIAETSGVGIRIFEKELPVKKEVRGICNLLGLDPLNMACEGRAVAVCPQKKSTAILNLLRSNPLGRNARTVGYVQKKPKGIVVLETELGGERIITTPLGEDLPRIC